MGHAISAIRGRFLLIFAFDKLNIRHISTSGLDLESVLRDAHLAVTVSTKFEVDTTIRCLVTLYSRTSNTNLKKTWQLIALIHSSNSY